MKRLLFVCSRNRLRSPTAQEVFSDYDGIEVDSAGLSKDADTVLSEDQVAWADVVIVMEKIHRERLNRKFGHVLKGKRVAVLGIPDDYDFMDPALIDLLKNRCAPHLP